MRWRGVVWCALLGSFVYYGVRAVSELITPNATAVDFAVYFRAASALAGGHHLYAPPVRCCFNYAAMANNYTYPPLMALLIRPLVGLGVDGAARVWLLVSHLSLAGSIVIWHRLIGDLVKRETFLLILAVTLVFGPVLLGLYGIQVANELLLMYSIAAWGFVRFRPRIVATAIAVGTTLKVAPVFMLLALFRSPWPFVRRVIAEFVVVLLALLAVLWLIVRETADYIRVLPEFLGGVIAPYDHSLPGVALQVLNTRGAMPGRWFNIASDVVAVVLLLVTFSQFRDGGTGSRRQVMARFAAILALLPIVSGVTWDHHLVPELLVLVLLAPSLRIRSVAWWCACAAIPLLSVYTWPIFQWATNHGLVPPTGTAWLPYLGVISLNLIGMVLLWISSLAVLRGERHQLGAVQVR